MSQLLSSQVIDSHIDKLYSLLQYICKPRICYTIVLTYFISRLLGS
jgi:hypothetical protein